MARNGQANLGLAIRTEQTAALIGPLLDPCDITKPRQGRGAHTPGIGYPIDRVDRIATARRHNRQSGKFASRGIAALDPNSEVLGLGFQRPGGQLDILGQERVFNVIDGQAPRRKRISIEPNPHGIDLCPGEVDLGHARNG